MENVNAIKTIFRKIDILEKYMLQIFLADLRQHLLVAVAFQICLILFELRVTSANLSSSFMTEVPII